MPGALLVVVGFLVIAVANYDALAITLAVGTRSRPLSTRVIGALRWVVRQGPVPLSAGGPIVVLGTVAVWISLLWVGYSLVFLADDAAVITAIGQTPASGISRVYYAGYTLFTLGNGGYAPAVGVWEILTVLTALNGLFVVTLSITFLVPVVSAVVQRRQLASAVSALGPTVEDAVVSAWDGEGFAFLEQQLPSLARLILLTAQRQLSYPVLHDFHSDNPDSAFERSLAMLDDVITVLQHGVSAKVQVSAPVLTTTRFAIDEARRLVPVDETNDEAPPPPDLTILEAYDIPVCSTADFTDAVAALDERRRHLGAMIGIADWPWPSRTGMRT